MKIKTTFSTFALFIAMLVNLSYLSSIPATDAAGAYRRSPCSTMNRCGRNGGWDMMPSSRYRHRRRNPIFDHMSEIFSVPIALNSLFEQQHRQIANAQRSATPRYDISEDDSKMELAFDLPGVRPEDISLEIQDNGTILKVSGSRKYRQHGEVVTTEFDQMFTIDDSVLDVEKISAKMSDGVLLVSAPKLEPKVKTQDRKIAVEENLVDAAEGEMKIVGTKDAKEKEEHTANEVDDTAGVDSEKDLEIGEEEDIE